MKPHLLVITTAINGGENLATASFVTKLQTNFFISQVALIPPSPKILFSQIIEPLFEFAQTFTAISNFSHFNLIYSTRALPLLIAKLHPKSIFTPKIYHFHGFSHSSLSFQSRQLLAESVSSFLPQKILILFLKLIYIALLAAIRYGFESLGLAFGTNIIVPTPESIRHLKQRYPFISRSKIFVIPNFTNPSIFFPVNSTPPPLSTFLWIGRISPEKNPDLFINVATNLPEYHFKLIYPDVDSQYQVDYLSRIVSIPNLELLANLSPKDLADHYQSATALIITSSSEHLPLTYLESIACGTPVIIPPLPTLTATQSQIDSQLITTDWQTSSFITTIKYLVHLSITQRKRLIQACLKISQTLNAESKIIPVVSQIINPSFKFSKALVFFLSLIPIMIGVGSSRLINSKNWEQISVSNSSTSTPLYTHHSITTTDRTGTVSNINLQSGKLNWQLPLFNEIYQSPQFYKGNIYLTAHQGNFYAVNEVSGKIIWQIQSPHQYTFSEPVFFGNLVILRTTHNELLSLNYQSGQRVWSTPFSPVTDITQVTYNDNINLYGDLVVNGRYLYFANPNGWLYKINPQTGEILWQIQTKSQLSNWLYFNDDSLYVGTYYGQLIKVSQKTGKILDLKDIESSQLICIQAEAKAKYIFHSSGNVYQFNPDLSKITKVTPLNYPLASCPTVSHHTAYFTISSPTYSVIAHDLNSNTQTWTYELISPPTISPQIYNQLGVNLGTNRFNQFFPRYEVVIIGDSSGNLYGIRSKNGSLKWQAQASNIINFSPTIDTLNHLYFSSIDGNFYQSVLSSPPAFLNPQLDIIHTTFNLDQNQIHEFALTQNLPHIQNPFIHVNYSGMFTSPSGKKIKMDGFYSDLNTWKIRFNPPEIGEWQYQISLKTPTTTHQSRGSFVSHTHTANSYLHLTNSGKSSQFTLDNTTLFPLIGIQETFYDSNRDGNPLNDWSLGTNATLGFTATGSASNRYYYRSQKTIELSEYLSTYFDNGKVFNTYRFGMENASFDAFSSVGANMTPSLSHLNSLDEFFNQLKNQSIRIWFSFLSWEVPYDPVYPEQQMYLKKYLQYLFARYSAYVDIWELANEAVMPESTAIMMADWIKQADFEHRVVTTSWELPQVDNLDLISVHQYTSIDPHYANQIINNLNHKFTKFDKPVVISEAGNVDTSKEKYSHERMRALSWIGFLTNTPLIYWNTADNPQFHSSAFANANLFIGPEERQSISVLNQLSKEFQIQNKSFRILTSIPKVIGYGKSDTNHLLGYFICQKPNSQFTVFHKLTQISQLNWINPSTGKVISSNSFTPATTTFISPPCNFDLILKITNKP